MSRCKRMVTSRIRQQIREAAAATDASRKDENIAIGVLCQHWPRADWTDRQITEAAGLVRRVRLEVLGCRIAAFLGWTQYGMETVDEIARRFGISEADVIQAAQWSTPLLHRPLHIETGLDGRDGQEHQWVTARNREACR